MPFRVLALADAPGWAELEAALASSQSNPNIVPKLMDHLRGLDAKSALIEQCYIDKDFSDSYTAYYARLFKRHTKLCTRILFFASDISFLMSTDDVYAAASRLESEPYLGFVVLRPISQAP